MKFASKREQNPYVALSLSSVCPTYSFPLCIELLEINTLGEAAVQRRWLRPACGFLLPLNDSISSDFVQFPLSVLFDISHFASIPLKNSSNISHFQHISVSGRGPVLNHALHH